MKPSYPHEKLVLLAAVFAAACAAILPGLGTFGLWEPVELGLAEQTRKLASEASFGEIFRTRPPLHPWLLALAVKLGGTSELVVRLPLAILGIVGLVATYWLGARLCRPRAGFYGAIVLLSSPLYLFQSRQLMSEIGTCVAGIVAVYGLFGLAGVVAPSEAEARRGRSAHVGDALLAALGLAVGFLAGGLFVGVFVPLAAVALAVAIASFSGEERSGAARPSSEAGQMKDGLQSAVPGAAAQPSSEAGHASRPQERSEAVAGASRRIRLVATLAFGAAALAALALVLGATYDLVPAEPGRLSVWGKSLVPSKTYVPLLGAQIRPGAAPPKATFDLVIEQIAYGMFPWSALVPIAVLRLLAGRTSAGRRSVLTGGVLVCWALVAYAACAWWSRRVGDIRYPALPALALAVGIFIDDVLRAKVEGAGARAGAATGALPLAAVFVFLGGLQLARDSWKFPDPLVSVHILSQVKMPVELKLPIATLVFGAVMSVLAAAGLFVSPAASAPSRAGLGPWTARLARLWDAAVYYAPLRRACQYGLLATVAIGFVFSLFLAHVYTPALSEHLSYKNLFQSYFEHRTGAEPLGVMGIGGSGPEYYARGPFERLVSRPQLEQFLARPERVFAIAPAGELCAIQEAAARGEFRYHVLDNRNSRFLLMTNRLAAGERDENPLLTSIRRTPFERTGREVRANFENKIELLGIDMPEKVAHGSKARMTLYFRVLDKVPTNQKVFVHIDRPGVRIIGDHDPIGGRCGTMYWQPGDYIADTFEVTMGDITKPRGRYEVYVGFFTGSSGNWKNMVVESGNGDAANRVHVGSIRVR